MDGGLATTGTDNQRTDGAGMTLAQLRARRSEILYLASAYDAHNVRVFGSMARGAADERSDIDFLVDIVTDAKGFAYFGLLEDLRRALTAVLQRDVDIVDSAGLGRLRAQILGEAVPL
jgi:predicted nucleotidyltransferase